MSHAARLSDLTTGHDSTWRRQVADAFSHASGRYEQLAGAQQALGQALWQRLPSQAGAILDLGCGPGHWSQRLQTRFGPNCRIIGLDIAPGMLATAQARHGEAVQWLQADAAALPIAPASLDLVFSNLALQWCLDLEAVFTELHRVLRPGGKALINTLGPGTLQEIGHAWGCTASQLDFRSADAHRKAAIRARFAGMQVIEHQARFHYADLGGVMASLKGWGRIRAVLVLRLGAPPCNRHAPATKPCVSRRACR
ncbi:methyltransferase domain-containing protein [Halomonas sp. E19]|uniref:methyltransferase domain-containing protein n=1 Tax=Halomonas sp. E19 TaxID=3397247 RepID=UPI004034E92B